MKNIIINVPVSVEMILERLMNSATSRRSADSGLLSRVVLEGSIPLFTMPAVTLVTAMLPRLSRFRTT